MTFAYLVMGPFDSRTDRAAIHDGMVRVIGVADVQDAIAVAKELQEQGISCIELCGAFLGRKTQKKSSTRREIRFPSALQLTLPSRKLCIKPPFPHNTDDKKWTANAYRAVHFLSSHMKFCIIGLYRRIVSQMSGLHLFDFFFQYRHDFKEVADNAVVSELENRSVGIGIDGDDDVRILNA